MATLNDKLAASLDLMNKVQQNGIVRLSDLSRTHRERLTKSGFLIEVIKGWFLVANPASLDGQSTSWYASFWAFLAQYLESRFGDGYALAPESSVLRHVRSELIPRLVIVIARAKVNQSVTLCFDTSIYVYHTKESFPEERVKQDDLWLMELPAALCRVSEAFFRSSPSDAEIALRMVRDPGRLLRILLEGGNTVVAGRLVGAYEYLGEPLFAEQIKTTMDAAGASVRAISNPFNRREPLLNARTRITSPHSARVQSLWAAMRPGALGAFSDLPNAPADASHYLADVEERAAVDAYNSLSIEGYQVSPELIDRVRRGDWNPGSSSADDRESDALAARGYFQAFHAVKDSIGKILEGVNPSEVVERDHQVWYREMFTPAVTAGILKIGQIAGYRNSAVYLRGSRYVPPSADAVQDCMETFFDLLRVETEPVVRAVLGHFVFVYIHPYSDGNGRIGRFLMNVMFASGRLPWTVIRMERRAQYLAALEQASTNHNIGPFARFVREEMQPLAIDK